MIPKDENNRNDVFDFVVDTMKDIVEKTNDDGTLSRTAEFNPDIAWAKGHMINQPFGRQILRLFQWEHLGPQCYNHMSLERAREMAEGIKMIGIDYRRSIDAKSSETYKDPHNTQDSLMHLLSKNKIVRQYDVKGDVQRTMLDGILHRDSQKDQERD